MGSRVRIVGRVMAVGVLAVLMSACLKLDMNLNVSSDNTVSGSVIFAVEKSLLELSGQSFDDILGSSAPLPSDAEGVSVKDYEDDQFAGKEYTFDSVPLEQFAGDSSGQLSITRDGDVFHVSGTLDLSSVGATGPSGLSGFDPGQFLQGAELKIRITFPGEVTESNGEVSGNSVTWVPVIGESLDLQATASATESGGSGSNLMMLLIIGGVVVVIAVVIGVVVSQRRKPAVATAGPAMDGGYSPPRRASRAPPREPPSAVPPSAVPPSAEADATGARLAPAPASARSHRAAVGSGGATPGVSVRGGAPGSLVGSEPLEPTRRRMTSPVSLTVTATASPSERTASFRSALA